MIGAGRLNRRITILKPQSKTGEMGEQTDAYKPAGIVWGEVRPLTSAETVRARAAELQITHSVAMRWTPILDATCRLSFAGLDGATHTLNVTGIVPDERGRTLDISAVEVTRA